MNCNYCQKCGQPNYYTTVKPSFCSSCASPFGSTPVKASKPRPKPKIIEQEIEEDEVIEEDGDIPEIGKLKYKIEADSSRGMKFGEVAYSGGTGGISRKPTNYTLEDFRREASNSKNSVMPEDLGGDE